ncbi:MAG TPA: CocE/NonD family hydrolase, partial [Marmoricola sp.]|nr:CocE/NonD family hydrolase [Marmoricola sp.]
MRIKKSWMATLALPFILSATPSAITSATASGLTVPRPFGHTCALQSYGVRFCPTAKLSQRVPSFDGAPLDVDVTLPARGTGPWPTIIMASPTEGDKRSYETTKSSGADNFGLGYSNVWFADRGYAVITYSLRGTFGSCGSSQSRQGYPACNPEQFEFGDQRYDAHDAQYLLGVLVDQKVADPRALGMTGMSLGSIETLEVALLKNHIRKLDGGYAPWRSPKGIPLHLSAAYSNASIPDVLDAAIPNGRLLTFDPATAGNDHSPIGVPKLSFPTVFALGTSPAFSYWDIPTSPHGFNLPGDVAIAEASPPGNPLAAAFA